jgi:tetratricopeptide (TPR) repeat protein
MERQSPRICKSILAVAAFLVSVAGCRQVGPSPALSGLAMGFDESSGKLKPKQAADVQVALARTLEMHGEDDKALALYEEAVKKDPRRSDAWLHMAILHDKLGQFAESANLYQKALKARPGSAEIYAAMGYSLYLQQRWPEAEMNMRQALTLRPDDAHSHTNLGLLLARTGQTEEALGEFHKAGCSAAEAHTNLAFALTLEQHWPEACQQYQLALQAEPSSLPAKRGLHELEQLMARMNAGAAAASATAGSPVAQARWTAPSAPAPSVPTANDASSRR